MKLMTNFSTKYKYIYDENKLKGFCVIVTNENGKEVGTWEGSHNEDYQFRSDLYVDKKYRRQGIGSLLVLMAVYYYTEKINIYKSDSHLTPLGRKLYKSLLNKKYLELNNDVYKLTEKGYTHITNFIYKENEYAH